MTLTSVKQYFEDDHARLDSLFAEFQSLKRTDAAAAKQKFNAFLSGLTPPHIWEEEILFPLFEERTGMSHTGPTEVMRQEHKIINRHLDAIHGKVRAADPESDSDEADLLDVLNVHNMKEERILYPAIDQALDDDAVKAVEQAMDAIPEERYAVRD